METGADVVAVETDRDVVPVLRDVLARTGARLVEGDATDLDWEGVLAGRDDWVLVANLPYNVATPLVLDVLRSVPAVRRMVVMVQLEAGERLAAGPGSGAYGIPSVLVAYHARAELLGRVPASVFLPVPRVESVLVGIERHREPPVAADLAEIEPLLRTAFGQRRKMLRRSLSGLVTPEQFAEAGVDPADRPERLGLDAWSALALARRG